MSDGQGLGEGEMEALLNRDVISSGDDKTFSN